MLANYINSFENYLLVRSKMPGGRLGKEHKDVLRDMLVDDFLQEHLSDRVGIGKGEIIDADTKPNQYRNANDVVIYRRDYPRLNLGDQMSGFLAESVVSTIEVKPLLTKEELRHAIRTGRQVKALKQHITQTQFTGYKPPGVLSYVVAFDTPVRMDEVYQWVNDIYLEERIPYPLMGVTHAERVKVPSPAVDGIFVLGKGSVIFDNAPTAFVGDEIRRRNPDMKWVVVDAPFGNLMPLFVFLTVAVNSVWSSLLNPLPYFANFSVPDSRVMLGS